MKTRHAELPEQTPSIPPTIEVDRPPREHAFRRGFVVMLPLWSGIVPFGIAFAILAKTTGFTSIETQAFSLLVFAGSAQVVAVSLVGDGAGFMAVVLTAVLLNLRYVLYGYGLSLRSVMEPTPRLPRPLLAFLLSDESYGMTIRAYHEGRGSAAFLFGASFSLYVCFGAATLAGSLLGSFLPDPGRLGLDVIFRSPSSRCSSRSSARGDR